MSWSTTGRPNPLSRPLQHLRNRTTRNGLSLLGEHPVVTKATTALTWSSPTGPKSKLSNGRTVTNLASYNYYNFIANETLKEKAIQTLRTYGVGPCGPPGFYGTQDVHMKTEADVAAHLGVPACIIYAQSFSTISSVIPSFSKRGDIIVADKAVNFAVRKGMQISRSTVRWFEHNDMEDLENVLKKVVKEQAKKPLTRRFIITEGLFENIGDVSNLPKLVRLA
jgi:serine palmitoyltransferase